MIAHLTTSPVKQQPLILTRVSKKKHPPFLTRIWASSAAAPFDHEKGHTRRRSLVLGMTAGFVLGTSVVCGNAIAAGRRPPPPPPVEKKDPNISGVAAKVLASKKRKEAMKEAVAKLREKGNTIQEPSS